MIKEKILELVTLAMRFNITITISNVGLRLSKTNYEDLEVFSRFYDFEVITKCDMLVEDFIQYFNREAERSWIN